MSNHINIQAQHDPAIDENHCGQDACPVGCLMDSGSAVLHNGQLQPCSVDGGDADVMDNHRAASILRQYKHWRKSTGFICVTFSREELNEAIDLAIAALEPRVMPTVDSIIEAVTRETGVTFDDMRYRCRCREYAEARWMVFYLARRYSNIATTSLQRKFSLYNHVSVLHGLKKANDYLSDPRLNPLWTKRVNNIIQQFDSQQ